MTHLFPPSFVWISLTTCFVSHRLKLQISINIHHLLHYTYIHTYRKPPESEALAWNRNEILFRPTYTRTGARVQGVASLIRWLDSENFLPIALSGVGGGGGGGGAPLWGFIGSDKRNGGRFARGRLFGWRGRLSGGKDGFGIEGGEGEKDDGDSRRSVSRE